MTNILGRIVKYNIGVVNYFVVSLSRGQLFFYVQLSASNFLQRNKHQKDPVGPMVHRDKDGVGPMVHRVL